MEGYASLELMGRYFAWRNDMNVRTFIMPDKSDNPEIRLVIVGKFDVNNENKLKKLVKAVEDAVIRTIPNTAKDTSRIRIQITGYSCSHFPYS